MYSKKTLEHWDKEYVWHPFTQMQQYREEEILMIARGEGSYLYDLEGNKYLDAVSSIWVTVHGHARPEINNAIKKQLDLVAHSTLLGQANLPSTLLAQKLVDITPEGLNKVFYSDNGATSTEVALKLAFQYWQQKGAEYKRKTKFISLKKGYHGDTIGSVSVGGVDLFHAIFRPLLFQGYKADAPYCYRCPLGLEKENCGLACTGQVEKIMKNNHDEIAAMIMEPEMIAAGGMLAVPRGYLAKIRQLCSDYNILLILDEVAVGFGRTGKMFACEHENVSPDIICLSKGITGGYLPLAATLTTDEIYNAFLGLPEEHKKFTHGHSYTGNQLGCAAALANLDIFEREKTIDKLQPKISFLNEQLKRFWELDNVGDIRQKGFMVGIELVKDCRTKEPYPCSSQIGHRVIIEARKRGLLLRPIVDVIEIVPPLTVSEEQLEFICENTLAAIKAVIGKE
ncbi:adenosylmethionine-8-amino-7-oxononanoate aminotransferase [Desulfohalotomaculum tongense]|uniref:adenosylmethionine--8-amino-7-oxononanoate transaminase n=1 Tax=Desulforadius tongensis TaxID=1216062 RepID=UPI001EE5D1D2|nr:adenosylmethionine--8-amino-7-oxononanoate transaminase [Desulforadius tongensis]MBM7854732.1 adenosylmethionine-8-amino-7-oxononanoate aminotransferase [Desulforadius tongensis]